jgi:RNA polymerase sigma factor (TIGR02999 family)
MSDDDSAPVEATILDAPPADLFPLVYKELRMLAARHLRNERPEHTLAPTALVHEAYLRMAEAHGPWQDRKHFISVASLVMRRILVDHAKERGRQKRGAQAVKVPLDEALFLAESPDPRIVAIDEALTRLEALDQRKAKIVEMLFFGGFTLEEIAEAVGGSVSTVHREVKFAKAWLSHEISRSGDL